MPRPPKGGYDAPYALYEPPAPGSKRTSRGYAVYRIAIKLPPDALGYLVTYGHPERRAELINRMELANGLVMFEVRVFGPGSADLAPVAKQVPAVSRVEVHRESAQSTMYRIVLRPPPLWKVLQRHQILTRYPLVYVDGWVRFETMAPPSQIRQLLKSLAKEVGPSKVEAVRHGSVSSSALGLTASQETVFRAALASGYFSSPRRTSLTGLAKQLGRSKSTVSQQLALIQRRLAESALRLKWAPMVYSA
jgi:predicted DNA binding protein